MSLHIILSVLCTLCVYTVLGMLLTFLYLFHIICMYTCVKVSLSKRIQFDYPEGPIPLRFLRLKHSNVRQNITYNCESGVDNFMLVKMRGSNGETVTFGDKTVRMISQVSIVCAQLQYIMHKIYM